MTLAEGYNKQICKMVRILSRSEDKSVVSRINGTKENVCIRISTILTVNEKWPVSRCRLCKSEK